MTQLIACFSCMLLLSSWAVFAPTAAVAEGAPRDALAEAQPVLLAQAKRRSKRPRRARPKPQAAEPATSATTPAASAPAPAAEADAQGIARGARVEFDGRLVQGQTARGALLLLARKRSELRSMVEERSSYRQEILRTV